MRLLPIRIYIFIIECDVVIDLAVRQNFTQSIRKRFIPYKRHDLRRTAPAYIFFFSEGKPSQHTYALPVLQRKHAVIFQKHQPFFGDFLRDVKSLIRAFLRFFTAMLHAFFNSFQNSLRRNVNFLFGNLSGVIIGNQLFIIFFTERHFQIDAGFQRRRSVVNGRPIGHHRAVETEFVASDIEKFFVFRSSHAVDAIVRAHHPFGMRFEHPFKRLEINLPQSSFVYFRGLFMAVKLFVIATIVFHTCGNTVFL